ncbi:MAG: hypothetical protein HY234_00420 [Acidobacteria bacterium]|nr:hypothetical protein [Acidobacteriota bacterium]MBI3661505.1 hypothetical protein [Acidobacteriota bacterium]
MRRLINILALFILAALPAAAQTWKPMGPPGGDVLTLAADPSDPQRIYLGTADGHIFGSTDAGETWKLLGRAGSSADGVVTAILVDPRNPKILLAAAWSRENNGGGGVFRSEDAGVTWRPSGLDKHAIRALAQAPSNPGILIAGALDGVFRSRDAARTWERISPEGNEEIRNLDSIAIDPHNPEIIYAGTFHLPWKTADGGRLWKPIHDGMIDDSDVMSIAVDRANPRRLYASACSGIYRSDDAGNLWRKIQGIPYTARRTHVIRQDPHRPQTIYAATTEGLWRTNDAGATWQRLTPGDWVINALVLDAKSHGRLVMGTEQLGVMLSDTAGKQFRAANDGFFHRQILALALDRDRPERVLAVLANAPEPVLATDDAGRTWKPLGPGLKAEAVRRVYALPGGWLAALDRGGLMRYDPGRSAWQRIGTVTGEPAFSSEVKEPPKKGRRIPARIVRGPRPLNHVVLDMAFTRDAWYAATDDGLLVSRDQGVTWVITPVGPVVLPARSVRISPDGKNFWVVTLRGMVFSRDAGSTWSWHDLPLEAGGALRLDVAGDKTILATAGKGLYISRDAGSTWRQAANGLPRAPIQDLAVVGDIFLVSMQTQGLYISYDRGATWARIEGTLAEGRFPVVTAREAAAIIYAASSTEGLYAVELPAKLATSSSPPPSP